MMQPLIYAMDTHFMGENEGPSPEEQAALVKSTGYDAYYVTGSLHNLERFHTFKAATDTEELGFSAAFETLDIRSAPTRRDLRNVETVLSAMQPPTRLEISMIHGGFHEAAGHPDKDEQALLWLEAIVPLLERYGIQGCLYPHFGFYLESVTDALRLSEKLPTALLGVMFCGYHWYRVQKEGEENLEDLLRKAGPKLLGVNLCGSRWLANNEPLRHNLNPSIEPLDRGDLDNEAIVTLLKTLNYKGPLGIQGYGINTTPSDALARSLTTLRGWL